ncbi:MAG: hypothetical protein FWD05_14565, partial [Oscillospiraceae bacterium]|nr:hypothetical protein [Oscillospiraceae bacterium]
MISALARDISDIMPAEAAYPSEVRSSYQTIGQDLYKLRSDVNAHEQYHLANDFTNFDEMMTGLCAFI